MALIKCHECGREMSSGARSCPHCGAKPRAPKKATSKLLLGLLALTVVGTVVISLQNRGANLQRREAESARVAQLSPEARANEAARKAAENAQQTAAAVALEREREAQQAQRKDVGLAEVTCQMAAEKSANDPSSIQWLRDERQFSYTASDKTRALSIQPMRAKNGAGGLVRTAVRCELQKTKNDWNVSKMSETR